MGHALTKTTYWVRQTAGCGNGQSHVKFAALAVEAERIEAGEAHGTAQQECEGQRQPPAGWQMGLIDDGSGHDAKGAGIDDGIEVEPKLGIAPHDPGELAIHFVEYRAQEDEPSGWHIVAVKGVV